MQASGQSRFGRLERRLRIGIIGTPQSGKTTVFTAVTGVKPTRGSTGPHLGVVHVPDARLDFVAEVFGSARRTPPEVTFVDMLPPGAWDSRSRGGIAKWIRDADGYAIVVGGPLATEASDAVAAVQGILGELVIADLVTTESRLERIASDAQRGRKCPERERDQLEALRGILESETPLARSEAAGAIVRELAGFSFLSARPVIVVLNRRDSVAMALDAGVCAATSALGLPCVCIDAGWEADLLDLAPNERELFREEGQAEESARDRVVAECFRALKLVTFYTAAPREARATTVVRGTTAHEAAGKIHADIQHGFVRAEVVPFDTLRATGSWAAAKAAGGLRLEGRDYHVADGDVIYFRFTS